MNLGYVGKQRAIILFDAVLSKIKIHKHYLQLLAVTCLLISIKSEESFCYQVTDACKHCENVYTKEEVLNMEMIVLKALKWRITYATPGEIARNLFKMSNLTSEENFPLIFKRIDCIVDYLALGKAHFFHF